MCWASVLISIVFLPVFGSLHTFPSCLESVSMLLDPLLGNRDMSGDSNGCRSVRVEAIDHPEGGVLYGFMEGIIDGKFNE